MNTFFFFDLLKEVSFDLFTHQVNNKRCLSNLLCMLCCMVTSLAIVRQEMMGSIHSRYMIRHPNYMRRQGANNTMEVGMMLNSPFLVLPGFPTTPTMSPRLSLAVSVANPSSPDL